MPLCCCAVVVLIQEPCDGNGLNVKRLRIKKGQIVALALIGRSRSCRITLPGWRIGGADAPTPADATRKRGGGGRRRNAFVCVCLFSVLLFFRSSVLPFCYSVLFCSSLLLLLLLLRLPLLPPSSPTSSSPEGPLSISPIVKEIENRNSNLIAPLHRNL